MCRAIHHPLARSPDRKPVSTQLPISPTPQCSTPPPHPSSRLRERRAAASNIGMMDGTYFVGRNETLALTNTTLQLSLSMVKGVRDPHPVPFGFPIWWCSCSCSFLSTLGLIRRVFLESVGCAMLLCLFQLGFCAILSNGGFMSTRASLLDDDHPSPEERQPTCMFRTHQPMFRSAFPIHNTALC
uniref:Uncharacterized protein n=1 Tax=Arundo donax TaxID=35708 RepID=A0A0A9CQ41_ARUDO